MNDLKIVLQIVDYLTNNRQTLVVVKSLLQLKNQRNKSVNKELKLQENKKSVRSL